MILFEASTLKMFFNNFLITTLKHAEHTPLVYNNSYVKHTLRALNCFTIKFLISF